MKLITTIGEREKHEIEAEASVLTGKEKVTIDGEEVIDKRYVGLSDTVRFEVGTEEKHEVRVKFRRGMGGKK